MVLAVAVLCVSAVCWASNYIVPTTTVKAQTSNNTSAANTFVSQSNGNRGAGNVSKVKIRSLLYPGATTKLYAHLMLWFGQSNHMNVGYSSTDPAQIKRQINDMITRGIEGVIIDWYGPNNSIDQATKLVMAEAENHPGFTFAIMIDQGAIEWDSCKGCTPQQALIAQLQYIEQTYFPSPAYLRKNGQPIVTNFNIDLSYSIDWNAVNAALSAQPVFLFQNNDGFTHTITRGSYSWVMPATTDYGMSYLTSFYDTGMSHPSEQTVGAMYKGFNDSLAAWGSGRIMGQQCGQTWLRTFSKVNGLYNSGKQLDDLQLVTWNDYEEGTEIESGIENCVGISASVSGSGLDWKTSGDERTIDHYRVYISIDGQNLMTLADQAQGLHSINLCNFGIPPGRYRLFVQAVGQASMANHISGAIAYSPACAIAPSNASPGAGPALQAVSGGRAGFTFSVMGPTTSPADAISLPAANLPSILSGSFLPVLITPSGGRPSSNLGISTVSVAGTQMLMRGVRAGAAPLWLLSFGLVGLLLFSGGRGDRRTVQ